MRAKSPLDQIQYLGDPVALPKPKLPIGTVIDISGMSKENLDYYGRMALRQVLRKIRIPIKSLRAEGYLKEMTSNKMLPFHKAKVRAMLDMMRLAESIEVAGHAPSGMHVVGTIGNQCYLQNGQCHGGVDYSCYLLFRRKVDGNSVVYLHPEPLVDECYIKAKAYEELA